MSLSTHGETLFHFTEEISVLFKILKNKYFKSSFSLEKISYETSPDNYAEIPNIWVPMVSFCDYKLSEINHHVLNYGPYGLGMTKDWANRNKLNPVFYVSKHSAIGGKMRDILSSIANAKLNGGASVSGAIGNADLEMANMFAWTKNYQGALTRKGRIIPEFRFADDKEWRHVASIDYGKLGELHPVFGSGYSFIPQPSIKCPQCGRPAALCEQQRDEILRDKKKEYSHLIDKDGKYLFFADCDVRFILVKNLIEKRDIIRFISRQKGRDDYQKMLLASKIVVIDELDFRALQPLI